MFSYVASNQNLMDLEAQIKSSRAGLSCRGTSLIRNTHPTRIRLDWGGRKYRGTSLIRNTPPAGPYSSPMPRDLW